MDYISSKETAQRWGISERIVQRYCLENRIQGAKKFGHYWMIPSDAEKPQRQASRSRKEAKSRDGFPFDDTCVVAIPEWQTAGEADKVLADLSGEEGKLFEMELAYYRGQAKQAHRLAKKLLEVAEFSETRLACLQVLALCAIYTGNRLEWMEAHRQIHELAPWRPEAEALKSLALASVRLSFLDLSTVPEWLKEGDFEKLPNYGSFQSVFIYIKYLQFAYKFELAKHVVKIALTRQDFRVNPIARSYLELTQASLTHSLQDDKSAKEHIRIALSYILPDGLYGIMVENQGWLDSLLEDVMYEDGLVEDWRNFVRIYEQYKKGWLKLGQSIIGENLVADLTQREWTALKYVANGLKTSEISAQMHVSVESVKKYLSSAYNKLGINGRNEIKSLLPLYGSGEKDKNSPF